jgi:hypothetical protein
MKSIALPIGLASLAGTIVPPTLFIFGMIAEDPMKLIMLVSCVAWFITVPLWMKSQ